CGRPLIRRSSSCSSVVTANVQVRTQNTTPNNSMYSTRNPRSGDGAGVVGCGTFIATSQPPHRQRGVKPIPHSTGSDPGHHTPRLLELRSRQQRALERIACSDRVALFQIDAPQVGVCVRKTPGRRVNHFLTLALQRTDRLLQFTERPLALRSVRRALEG